MSHAPPKSRRVSVGAVLIGMVAGVLLTLVVILVWFWLHRDPTPPLTAEALDRARQRWAERRVLDYDMEIQLAGQREGTLHVEVRGGEVTQHTNNGHTPPRRSWDYWSVEGMLDAMERELEVSAADVAASDRGASQMVLRAAFDAQYGYPRVFHRLALGAGAGASNRDIRWEVTRFEPRAGDRAASR
jgi:hypothetical protein